MSESESNKFTKQQRFALFLLSVNQFMFTCAISMIAPVYPKEVSDRGGNEIIGGLIFSFYALLIFIFSPICGKLAPKIGLKTAFTVGLIISGIGNILFGTVSYVKDKDLFIGLSFTFRAIESIGATAFVSTSNVMITEIFPNNIGFVMGVCEIFNCIGFSLGPAVAGLLYSFGGFHLPFTLLGALMILMTPLNRRIISLEKVEEKKTNSGLIFKMLVKPSILLTSLMFITTAITMSCLEPTLEPHLRKYGLSAKYVGLIFLTFPTTFAIAGFSAGWISDNKSKYRWHLMNTGLIISTVSLLALGPTTIYYVFRETLHSNIIALSILGGALGLVYVPSYQCLIEGAKEGGFEDGVATQSAISAIAVSSYSLGNVVGPVTAGFLYTEWGFAPMTDLLAGMSLILCFIATTCRVCHNGTKLKDTKGYRQVDTTAKDNQEDFCLQLDEVGWIPPLK